MNPFNSTFADEQNLELTAAQRCVQGPSGASEELHSLRLTVCLPLSRFDNELTQALEEAENEREQRDKVSQENAALGAEIYTLRRSLQVRKL